MAETAPRQLMSLRFTTVTARRARGPLTREDAIMLQSIHIFEGPHHKQTVRTPGKPLISRVSNATEDFGGITVVSVENESSLDVQAGNATRCQIGRANVSYLATTLITKMNCLRMVETVSIGHDSKIGVRTGQPKSAY